jgi:hypothetical protein
MERQRRKQTKMNEKARAMANKMNKLDVAMDTTMAESFADLGERKGQSSNIYRSSTTAENCFAKGYTCPFPRHRNIAPNQTTQFEDASVP